MTPPATVHVLAHLRLGAGRYIVDVALEQHRRSPGSVLVAIGDDVDANWSSDPDLVVELGAAGVEVLTVGDVFRRDPLRLRDAARALAARLPGARAGGVVHAHTAMAAAVGRWAGADRVVCTCHGWNPGRPVAFDLQDALAFGVCDAVTSPSTYWAERVEALSHRACLVVPCGFDLSRYPTLPHAHEVRPPRVACVGELTRRKGQDVLVAAMPAVWNRRPDAEVHFFGTGDAADELAALARSVDARGGRLVFHGHVARPYDHLSGFDVLCLPTRSDNQPVAIVEAMLAGVRVVATDVGGIPEMLDACRGGWTVPADDPAALAGAVVRALAMPTAARAAMNRATQALARANHDVRAIVTRLEALYLRGSQAAPGRRC